MTTQIKEGYCHGCIEKVDQRVCICSRCLNKGITHESLGLINEWKRLYGEAREYPKNWYTD